MKAIVRIFAIVLLLTAVAFVFFYEPKPQTDDTPPPVRPVKSILVGAPPALPTLRFPGTVDARAGVDLSFEVSGRIVEFPVIRGQEVKEGDVLARLDDRDYANAVKTAKAELAYAESNFKRMEAALDRNAVSQDEFSSARASRDKARASLDTAKKALDDTVLKARFSGVVSDTYADNFDTVSSGTPVLKLQDMTAFDLIVYVPESYVLSGPADVRVRFLFEASFDSLPGRTFPVTVKDAAHVADAATQTYRATFALDAPEDVTILPGMTCTVTVRVPDDALAGFGGGVLAVPSNAVGAASDTSSFVWRLEDNGDGTFTARRATVTLGERVGEHVCILSGLSAGDRVATAGVTILTEGRIVRLYEENTDVPSAFPAANAPAAGENP